MEINKTNDEKLKKIAAEIRATGVAKKKTQNGENLSFQEKLLKSVISPNHKEVIQRIMRVDKKNSNQIEDKHTQTNDDEISKKADQIIEAALEGKYGSMRYDYKGDTNEGEVTAVKDDINIKEALSNPLLKGFLTGKMSVDEELASPPVSVDEELASPSFNNQFMNDDFLSNSSVVLNSQTALNQDLRTRRHIDIGKYYIDEEDIEKCKETNKEELMILFNLETILKKYTNDSDFNILLLSDEALEELIKEANDNGEQIKALDESTKNVKRKLYRRRKCTDGFYDCV